jgi:hypothetical protein
MASLCSFSTNISHDERLLSKFQQELDAIHKCMPPFISGLPTTPSVGPKEWLLPVLGDCACGNCSNSNNQVTNLHNLTTMSSLCCYVDCFVSPPASSNGDSNNSSCYAEPTRVRVIVKNDDDIHSSSKSWPIIRFLDPYVLHLGINDSDGVLKQDIVDLYTEDDDDDDDDNEGEMTGKSDSEPTVLNILHVVHKMLVSRPPEEIFGPSFLPDGSENQVHHLWRRNALSNRSIFDAKTQFKNMCPYPYLIDSDRVPKSLEDFVLKSSDWPEGIISQALYQGLKQLQKHNSSMNGNNISVEYPEQCFDHTAANVGKGEDCLAQLIEGGIIVEESQGVYGFDLFTDDFCAKVVETLELFDKSGLPQQRPNSMNRYGTIVNNIGMSHFMDAVQKFITRPLALLLWPSSSSNNGNNSNKIQEANWLDSHHTFSIRYKPNEDLGLDMHTDDSEITMNVCLGKPGFQGAGLVFCGGLGESNHRIFKHKYVHKVGKCVMHRGRQRHGADDITSGERVNLVMWSRSLAYRRFRERNQPNYDQEEGPPSLQCLSYTHDRDYDLYHPPRHLSSNVGGGGGGGGVGDDTGAAAVMIPEPPPPAKRQGWCPPPGKEYQPDAWPAASSSKHHKPNIACD